MPPALIYLQAYPESLQQQVQQLIAHDRLTAILLKRYPRGHDKQSNAALHDYVQDLKNQFMRNAPPLGKVHYDAKIQVLDDALGQHIIKQKSHGGQNKTRREIKIATLFKHVPDAFLNMIVVHELAHFKEREHNKAFYQLCRHMNADYHQHEFDVRVYLTHIDLYGVLWQ